MSTPLTMCWHIMRGVPVGWGGAAQRGASHLSSGVQFAAIARVGDVVRVVELIVLLAVDH
jgi:hypothetical protein